MIELRRARSRLKLSLTSWMLTLELAKICGWQPAGTLRQVTVGGGDSDSLADVQHLMGWQTQYLSNDGQTVSASDATQLAAALARAASEGDRILSDWSAGRIAPPADIRNKPSGFRWFSTLDGRDQLEQIAGFCRGGEFQIF
jgi:hypothetical protein